jgi:hypothetical protein
VRHGAEPLQGLGPKVQPYRDAGLLIQTGKCAGRNSPGAEVEAEQRSPGGRKAEPAELLKQGLRVHEHLRPEQTGHGRQANSAA